MRNLTSSLKQESNPGLTRRNETAGGVSGLGIRDDGAARPPYGKACGSYSAATSEAMAISKARVFCNDSISA